MYRSKYFMLFLLLNIYVITSCKKPAPEPLIIPSNVHSGDIILNDGLFEVENHEYKSVQGSIFVYENRDNPESRLISLPIIRILATGSNPKAPIFILNGGPGASNLKFKFLEGLIQDHDIVLVGYRGVDGPISLKCPEIDELMGNLPGDLTDQNTIIALTDAYTDCASRLKSEGVDTDGYTMLEVVHDIEEVRKALGYDKIHFISQSYGTRLAMIYSWVFPKYLLRSAMISVNPPGHFVWYPEVIDEQLSYYAKLCAQDEYCRNKTKDLTQTISNAQKNMPKRWLLFPIKKGNILMGTFMMLYNTGSAAQVFDAWIAAEKGDWSGMALLSLALDKMMGGAWVWGESAAKAMVDYRFEHIDDPLERFMPKGSFIGAPATVLGIAGTKGWPTKLLPDSLSVVKKSETQTLLISGNIDFSTPAKFARDELLPFLTNGNQVILSEFGHTGDVWNKQNDATMHLLSKFLNTGEVDESKFTYEPVSFKVKFSYSFIMKSGIVLIILGLILLIFLGRLIIRRIRRK